MSINCIIIHTDIYIYEREREREKETRERENPSGKQPKSNTISVVVPEMT